MLTSREYSTKGIPLIRGCARSTAAEVSPATVLCAYLHGYDALVESLPPAEVALMLGEFFDILTGAVLEFGGHIFQLAEADMLAGFGVGDARHAGIHEAVAAAHRIQRRFAPIQASWRNRCSIDAAVGVGIDRGEVAIGVFGPQEHSARTLVGDTAHLAAQLCRRARAGEILLSSPVYLAHRSFAGEIPAGGRQFLHLPQLHLHGRSIPLDVWCAPAVERLKARDRASAGPSAHH